MARAERFKRGERGFAAALVVLCALVTPALVCAQASEPIALTWHAPTDCAGARNVLDRVHKLTHAAHFSDRQLRAEATITLAERGRLHLKLVLRAGSLVGERSIEGRTCEDLAGATAVVLALLLNSGEPLSGGDLDGRAPPGRESAPGQTADRNAPQGTEPAPVPGPIQTSDGPKPSEAARPSGSRARTQRDWQGLLQLPVVSLGFGPVPGPSIGFSLAGGIVFARWRFVGEAGAWLKQTLTSRDQPGSRADVQRIEAAVRSCRALPFGRFELAPCLRVSVQHVWARGKGAHIAARTAQATWVAAGLGVQARYQVLDWFGVFAGIDAHIETSRPRIAIDGIGNLGQLWPAAFTIAIGSEWIL